MNDDERHLLAGNDPEPDFLDLTEQITQRLQAGELVHAGDYARSYPQWAGAIGRLLPTILDLVYYGRTVARDRSTSNLTFAPTILAVTNDEQKEVVS
jgi:hypothetical protein